MCDTFVALSNSTKDNSVIFGKNSDRPQNEVQLITHVPRRRHSKGEELHCTYISVPQVSETFEVLLSQPWWIWGAEMGVNEHGVAIGNEAVYSHEPLRNIGLLGMDILRLGLERGKTAKNAITIMTELLEKYHQGGGCAYNDPSWLYHNSFIITDPKEAYVLETADDWWIVEKINNVRSISNSISIRGKGDIRRNGIIQHAVVKDYCRDDEEFDFAINFSGRPISDTPSQFSRGGKSALLLNNNKGIITPELMMEFLREHDTAGICMHGGFESTGSQVSHLRKNNTRSIHWFTGSTLPCSSIYKPYIFPVDGQNVLESGPYSEINPEWFWIKHSKFTRLSMKAKIKEYKDKIKETEQELIGKVNDVAVQENKLSDDEYIKKIKAINQESWKKSNDMILK